jgi:hypothetical protein
MMFGHIADMTVKCHCVGDAAPRRMVDEALAPPAIADDVEMQIGDARPQDRDRFKRILNLLVWHQPRQHNHPRSCRAWTTQRLRRCLVKAVAHHGYSLVVDTKLDQVTGRRQRHRHILVAPVQSWRQRRLDIPAEPADHGSGHRPLLAVAMVHQHHHSPAVQQPGQKRQTVLGIDHHVRPHPPQRSESDPSRSHRDQRKHIHRIPPASAVDPHAVDRFPSRRAGIPRGAQRDSNT